MLDFLLAFVLVDTNYLLANEKVTLSHCRSKGNISGRGTQAPEARSAWGVWGHAPPENFEI